MHSLASVLLGLCQSMLTLIVVAACYAVKASQGHWFQVSVLCERHCIRSTVAPFRHCSMCMLVGVFCIFCSILVFSLPIPPFLETSPPGFVLKFPLNPMDSVMGAGGSECMWDSWLGCQLEFKVTGVYNHLPVQHCGFTPWASAYPPLISIIRKTRDQVFNI